MKKSSVFVARLFTTLFLFLYIFAQPILAIVIVPPPAANTSDDHTAPTVFLTAPVDNFFTNQTSVLQTWDTTDTDYRSCTNNPTVDGSCDLIYSQTLTTKSRTVNNNNIAFWWQVRGIDSSLNVGEWTDARKITIDTVAPSIPQNLGFSNPVLSCGAYTNIGINTVDWDNSTDNFGLAGYDYNIDYPLTSGGRGSWNAFFTNSQYRGTFNEGLHQIKVRAKDKAGNVSAWTPLCDITYDSILPEVPSGIYFRDTDNEKDILCNQYVNTKHLDVYWNAILGDPSFSHYEYSSFNAPSGSAGLIQKIFYTNYFNSSYWTIPIEGTYGVQLRSVDLAGNKSAWYGGTVGINNSCKFIVDWTSPDVEINNPAEEYVSGIVDIRGTVTDLHPHHYWLAIYSGGTQIAGPGTVNRSDSFTNESLMTWNTTLLPDGVYIIKLEARDAANNKDAGSVDWHTVYVDNDNDKVLSNDLCPLSTPDSNFDLGVNRHVWYGGEDFTTLVNKKGVATEKDSVFSIADTHGCSCEQILGRLVLATGESFGGHYKFGCSKSIIEDWIDGKYWIEKVTVPAINSEETLSTHNLLSGETYLLRASGTADAGDGIEFDAKYSFRTPSSTIWTDAVSTYESYGTTLLDLLVNGTTPWGTYNNTHIYESEIVGDGSPVGFKIHDVYYPNNIGNLFVDIFVELY